MKKKVNVVMLPTVNGEHIGNYNFILYFTSNDEIKEGDWYYQAGCNFIFKVPMNISNTNSPQNFKIVATTDHSLGLPLIPESFVRKYVEEEGKIKEVNVNTKMRFLGFTDEDMIPMEEEVFEVRKDNTVIVSKIKDTYTREEMILAYNEGASHAKYASQHENGWKKFDEIKQDWINENL